jgi:hypothetical protein
VANGEAGLWERADFGAAIRSGRVACPELAERGGGTPPPVFFVRVADKGLRLDAASRASTRGTRLLVEGSKLKGKRFGELNTEAQSTQWSETGTDLEKLRAKRREAGLATSIGYGSTEFDYCQG